VAAVLAAASLPPGDADAASVTRRAGCLQTRKSEGQGELLIGTEPFHETGVAPSASRVVL